MKQLAKSIFTCIVFVISFNTFSQERKILGRILDSESQKPIQNANVFIPGTTLTAASNRLGFFELAIDPSKHKTIVASHIGFKTSTIDVPAGDRFKFVLEKEYILLSRLNLKDYPKLESVETVSNQPFTKKDNKILAESGASYPGGISNFYDFVGNSLARYGVIIEERGVNVTFTINEIGRAANVTVSETTDSIRTKILKTFERMPTWTAAAQGPTNAPQHFVLPLAMVKTPVEESFEIVSLYSYLSQNINYPIQALRMGIEGVVFVEFEVDKSGTTHNIKLLKDIGAECGKEVTKTIGMLTPSLSQALCKQTNATKFVLPVCFGLNGPFQAIGYRPTSNGHFLGQTNVVAKSRERDTGVQTYGGLFPNPKTDTSFFYYKNGKVKTKGRYVGQARFGIWTNFYESGRIKDKVVFDDVFIAAIECYDETGKPTMVNGTGEWETKYFDAIIKSEVTVRGSYKDTLRNGTWNYYERSLLNGEEMERLVCTEVFKDGKFVKGKYYWGGGGIEDLHSPVFDIMPVSTIFRPVSKSDYEYAPFKRDADQAFDKEQFPQFPGGTEKFLEYVKKEFRCSSTNRGADKKVFVEFRVDSTGYIKRELVRIVKGDLGKVCTEQLIKVLENSPKWKPAKQLGRYVSFKMVMPIKFG